MSSIRYEDHSRSLSRQALETLFESAGLRGRTDGRILRAFQKSFAVCAVFEGETLVGAARAISDGEYHAFIYDVAVLPSHQKLGIGREMMRRLLEQLPVWRVMLRAAPDVQPFYDKFGFDLYDDVMARVDSSFFASDAKVNESK